MRGGPAGDTRPRRGRGGNRTAHADRAEGCARTTQGRGPGAGTGSGHEWWKEVSSGDVALTIVGNLVADPELRFTPSGAAVANFTVASAPRIYDKQRGEWKDGEALFMRCTIWREAAENATESLTRGTRVIVTGRLRQRNFETREGEKRSVVELDVEEIGPSLRYASAKVSKNGGRGSKVAAGRGSRASDGAADDPWGSARTQGSFAGSDDPPPF